MRIPFLCFFGKTRAEGGRSCKRADIQSSLNSGPSNTMPKQKEKKRDKSASSSSSPERKENSSKGDAKDAKEEREARVDVDQEPEPQPSPGTKDAMELFQGGLMAMVAATEILVVEHAQKQGPNPEQMDIKARMYQW